MSFEVPTSWEQLTQEQLCYVVRLLWLYGEAPDWQERVRTAAFLRFCGLEVYVRTDLGWLCRELKTGKTFLLDTELLPSLLQHLDWLCHTDQMTVRIERVDGHKAVDFELRELMFGDYLMAENFYQAFLLDKDSKNLLSLAKILYAVPDGTAITQESQYESTQAQIRLLTKGDVTKQKYILEQTDTWTALAELDALAKDVEETKRKYGK